MKILNKILITIIIMYVGFKTMDEVTWEHRKKILEESTFTEKIIFYLNHYL